MDNINWTAVIGTCAMIGTVGGVVHFTVKGALAQFREDLRKDFATKEWGREVDRRLSHLEQGV